MEEWMIKLQIIHCEELLLLTTNEIHCIPLRSQSEKQKEFTFGVQWKALRRWTIVV
jgi:hypothetical protein